MSSNYQKARGQLHELTEENITNALDYADCTAQVAAALAATPSRVQTAGTYILKPTQHTVLVKTTATGAWTLVMPPVAKCAGEIYSIRMTAHDTNDVTVTDYKDDTSVGTLGGADLTLNLALDACILYSDGLKWSLLYSTGL
jgi:putative methionine-R-sulfoxide reductase with GAF domain